MDATSALFHCWKIYKHSTLINLVEFLLEQQTESNAAIGILLVSSRAFTIAILYIK